MSTQKARDQWAIANEGDTEKCRTCGLSYNLYDDGYEGECPTCADKSEDFRANKRRRN